MSVIRRKRVLEPTQPSQLVDTSWIDAFLPKVPADLAVHHQKVSSVVQWLKMCRPNKSAFLLLTGPPGSGKTACVRVLAEELGYELQEWVSPPDEEYSRENFTSQKDKFLEFLFKSSRYHSLFHQKPRLLLVEDFPNILIDQKTSFPEILSRYKEVGKSPLIFIATETKSKSLNIAYNLFPNDVQSQFGINNITFNAVSTTLMKKALQNLLGNLKAIPGFNKQFQEPTPEVLESLIVSSQGDIRNAILNLQFVSQKNLPKVSVVKVEEISNKDVANKRSKRPKETKKLKEIGCDETLSMMHGIGRVFNPKYDPETRLFTHCPETITSAFSTQPQSFVMFLFSNYLPHFSSVDDVAQCVQSLTVSDYFLKEYRDQNLPQLALNIGIRGSMVANSSPISGWIPVKGHKQNHAKENEVNVAYERFISRSGSGLISKNTFVLDFSNCLAKIKGNSHLEANEDSQEDLEQAELDLIQQIEMVDSD